MGEPFFVTKLAQRVAGGSRDAPAALYQGTLQRAAPAGQAVALTARDASDKASEFGDSAMEAAGVFSAGFVAFKGVDLLRSRLSPQGQDATTIALTTVAILEGCRQAAKHARNDPAIGDIPDSHC